MSKEIFKPRQVFEQVIENTDDIELINTELKEIKEYVEGIINNPDFSGYYTKNEIDDKFEISKNVIDLLHVEVDVINNQVSTNITDIDTINAENVERDIKIDKNINDILDNTDSIITNSLEIVNNANNISTNTANLKLITEIVNNSNEKFSAHMNMQPLSGETYITFSDTVYNDFGFTFLNDSTLIGVETNSLDINIIFNTDANLSGSVELRQNDVPAGTVDYIHNFTADDEGNVFINFSQKLENGSEYRLVINALGNLISGTLLFVGNVVSGTLNKSSQIIDDYDTAPADGINLWKGTIKDNSNDVADLQTDKINALEGVNNLNVGYFTQTTDGIYPVNFQNSALNTTSKFAVDGINEVNTKINNLEHGEVLIWDGGIGSDIDEVTFTMPEGYTYLYTLIYHYYTGGSYIAHGVIKIDKLNTEYANYYEGGAGTNTLTYNETDGTWTLESDSPSDNLYQIWGVK